MLFFRLGWNREVMELLKLLLAHLLLELLDVLLALPLKSLNILLVDGDDLWENRTNLLLYLHYGCRNF